MFMLPHRVESERLVLRQWTVADADALAAAVAASIEHLRPFMPWIAHEPTPRSDRVALIESWRAEREHGGDSVCGIFVDDLVVGTVGMHRRGDPDVIELGYWLHVDHLGQGYATEAARAAADAVFDRCPDIAAVEIHHDAANQASGRVPVRLGFTRVRVESREPSAVGESGEEWQWAMTRAEWVQRTRRSMSSS